MLRNHTLVMNVLFAAVMTGVSLFPAQSGYGADEATFAATVKTAPASRSDEDMALLRRELTDMTQALRKQQTQIEQLQNDLAANRPEPGAMGIHRVPPVTSTDPVTQQSYQEEVIPAAYRRVSARHGHAVPWIDIGGQYRVMYNASNFAFHPTTINDTQASRTFFNQRFRTWLTIRPNAHVEGYVQAEMGHIFWGNDNFDFPKTYAANGDIVGVELRRGWVAYQNHGLGRLRAGIQGWQDSFDQTLASSDWDFSVGGLSWERTAPSLGNMEMLFGLFSLFEGMHEQPDDAVLLTLDLDWDLSPTSEFGVSAYYLPDSGDYSYPTAVPYDSATDVWLGMRYGTQVGGIPLRGFAIYNSGKRKTGGAATFTHDGAALKLELGAIPIGCGELSFQTLYSTGDEDTTDNRSHEFRTVAQSIRSAPGVPDFGSQGYWSYLVITSPHGPSDVNDLGVSLQNRSLGLFTIQAKYDYPIYGRLSGTLAGGWLRSDTTNPVSGAKNMGTELANIFTLNLGGGLTVDMGAGVLFTGDFYEDPANPNPDDLWEVFTRTQLEF